VQAESFVAEVAERKSDQKYQIPVKILSRFIPLAHPVIQSIIIVDEYGQRDEHCRKNEASFFCCNGVIMDITQDFFHANGCNLKALA
jgi:hypothetical protein